jgi:hypothetical protein
VRCSDAAHGGGAGKLKHKHLLLDNPHVPPPREAGPPAMAALGRRRTGGGADAERALPPPRRAPPASAREARRLGLHAIAPEYRKCVALLCVTARDEP